MPTLIPAIMPTIMPAGGGGNRTPLREVPLGILLHESQGGAQFVAVCCERCWQAGVRPGMSVAQAKALLEEPLASRCLVQPMHPQRDAAGLRRLGAWATRYAPLVWMDASSGGRPDGLVLDITGCHRLYRSETILLRRIERDLALMGVRAVAAAASTLGCAWAMARYGGALACSVPAGGEREAVASLPVRALRLDPATVATLRQLEIAAIGDLLPLPRNGLASRFGSILLQRIDEALGRIDAPASESIEPIRVVPPLHLMQAFDGPCPQPEAVAIVVQQLLAPLCERLLQQARGARRLELVLRRAGAGGLRCTLTLSRPCRDPRHLWSLLQPRLERADLAPHDGCFGVESVELAAIRTAPMPIGEHEHLQRLDDGGRATALAADLDRLEGELVDALVGRCGPERLVRIRPLESHLPEQALERRPVVEETPSRESDAAMSDRDRPSLLLPSPEPIEVALVPIAGERRAERPTDGGDPPSRLRWRSEWLEVCRWIGPERIVMPWWPKETEANGTATVPSAAARDPPHRDYFRVEDHHGRWLWVFCERPAERWFVHGAWV